MPRRQDQGDSIVDQAGTLARAVAAEIDSVLFTHFADPDTLDTLRPGGADLATTIAVNRAAAAEMAAAGVEVFVQRADRAGFRRWLQTRDDTKEGRRGWIDRTKLLRGAEALRLLGVGAPGDRPRPKFGTAPGPIADRLIAAFNDGNGSTFPELAQALLAAGRDDVLTLAVRKLGKQHEDEADALEGALIAMAEGGELGPSGWAELVILPVALPARDMPDAASLATSFLESGILADRFELRFLPGWRSPEALEDLAPSAVRAVLLDLIAGVEPRDLPPGDTDDLAIDGFGLLLGLQFDWDIPIWDEIAAGGQQWRSEEDDAEDPEQARQAARFDIWRAAIFEAHPGCLPLALVPPSEVETEIAEFIDEAGAQTGGIDEIRGFVSVARDEAGTEEVVCRLEVLGTGLELTLYTAAGRYLDSLTLSADRMPAKPDEMAQLIGSFVRVVTDQPGS